jgi:hypothetical protein
MLMEVLDGSKVHFELLSTTVIAFRYAMSSEK